MCVIANYLNIPHRSILSIQISINGSEVSRSINTLHSTIFALSVSAVWIKPIRPCNYLWKTYGRLIKLFYV